MTLGVALVEKSSCWSEWSVAVCRGVASDESDRWSPLPNSWSGSPGAYLRLQVRYCGRLGVPVGIFVAVDHLRRRGSLSASDEELYFGIEDFFLAGLPQPPFYADGNTIGAVTWFKAATAWHLIQRLDPLRDLLTRHGVANDLVASNDPGVIVYEDEWQVGVVPYQRAQPTPLPAGVTMGPTTAGSKRALRGDRGTASS
jgi:hypothetical protein